MMDVPAEMMRTTFDRTVEISLMSSSTWEEPPLSRIPTETYATKVLDLLYSCVTRITGVYANEGLKGADLWLVFDEQSFRRYLWLQRHKDSRRDDFFLPLGDMPGVWRFRGRFGDTPCIAVKTQAFRKLHGVPFLATGAVAMMLRHTWGVYQEYPEQPIDTGQIWAKMAP